MTEEADKITKIHELIEHAREQMRGGPNNHAAYFINSAVQVDPDSKYALTTKSNFLAARDRYDEANLYLNRILSKNPQDVETLFEKGTLFANLGIYTEAMRYFEEAIHIREDEDIKQHAEYRKGYLEWNNECAKEYELEHKNDTKSEEKGK